jgi:hypothetical protein
MNKFIGSIFVKSFFIFCAPPLFHAVCFSQTLATSDSTIAGVRDTTQIMSYRINDRVDFIYERPKTFEFIGNSASNLAIYSRITFQKKNIVKIGAMTAITALFVAYDQELYDGTRRLGQRLHISSKDNTKTYISIGDVPLFRGPSDLGSTLYFIGDGWTHTAIAAGFLSYGLAASDNRALQTASQLAEGMLAAGFSTQLIKHITGRETPATADAPGGVWRLFPNQAKYHKHVPNYDAFPSGHLATAMMTVTVIAENYPEHKYIRPLGYTLMTLLSFQMINNGVHWASDYPLALAMGYSMGKIAAHRGRKIIEKNDSSSAVGQQPVRGPVLSIMPVLQDGNRLSVSVQLQF